MEQYNRVVSTPFGPVVILWSLFAGQPAIFHVLLSHPALSAQQKLAGLYPESIAETCPVVDKTAGNIKAFLDGEDIHFSLHMVRLDLCSRFQQEVLHAEHKIPRGCVSTYQRIAAYLGNQNGARAVGNALANNPFPIIIPCHRAIRSDRLPGGFQGGTEMKRTILEMEGIHFNKTGLAMVENFFY
ncbi:MAG: MGMT family protein [Spirochaetales bacterium]|nr:MGMT family protein [Spirochaetales bacterium]